MHDTKERLSLLWIFALLELFERTPDNGRIRVPLIGNRRREVTARELVDSMGTTI